MIYRLESGFSYNDVLELAGPNYSYIIQSLVYNMLIKEFCGENCKESQKPSLWVVKTTNPHYSGEFACHSFVRFRGHLINIRGIFSRVDEFLVDFTNVFADFLNHEEYEARKERAKAKITGLDQDYLTPENINVRIEKVSYLENNEASSGITKQLKPFLDSICNFFKN